MVAAEISAETHVLSPWERYLNSEEAQGALWQGAKALAHPVRVKILRYISSERCCFCGEFSKKLNLAQSTVSQHLKVLKDAGFLWEEPQGPAVCYGVNRANLKRWQVLVASL